MRADSLRAEPAPAHGERARGSASAPGKILSRPWFWALGIAMLFSFPLVKSLTATLPPPLPGQDGPQLSCELPDETGAPVSLESLRGHLVLVSSLPLANATASGETLSGLFRLRKHLRGLDKAVAFVLLCRGDDATALSPLLDERKARKPLNLFLLDPHGDEFTRLCTAAGSPAAEWLLLDRYGRVRGAYTADEASLQALVSDTGLLANWAGQDTAPL